MHIWRGQLSIKQVLAKEYADAGGKLSPQEAEALVSLQASLSLGYKRARLSYTFENNSLPGLWEVH